MVSSLIQAANRDLEKQKSDVIPERHDNQVMLARRHHVENEIVYGQHLKFLSVNKVVFKCNTKDACFKTKNGDVGLVSNIVQSGNVLFLVGYAFRTQRDLYLYPFPSSDIGILSVSDLGEERQAFSLHDVECKCWLMPDGESFACFPLLHTLSFLH